MGALRLSLLRHKKRVVAQVDDNSVGCCCAERDVQRDVSGGLTFPEFQNIFHQVVKFTAVLQDSGEICWHQRGARVEDFVDVILGNDDGLRLCQIPQDEFLVVFRHADAGQDRSARRAPQRVATVRYSEGHF